MKRGFSLVELLVALTISLFLLGGLTSFYIANKRTSWLAEDISRIIEVGQVAFELMARDIREAGGNPCGTSLIANVLCNVEENINKRRCKHKSYSSGDSWALDWKYPIYGMDEEDSIPTNVEHPRAPGTDAILVRRAVGLDDIIVIHHIPESAVITVRAPLCEKTSKKDCIKGKLGYVCDGDILLICNPGNTGAIFQAVKVNCPSYKINHATGRNSLNCTSGLGYPQNCDSNNALGNLKDFTNGVLSLLSSSLWYVGCNGREDCNNPSGRSLYRKVFHGNLDSVKAQEIAEGIWNMQIKYRLKNSGGWLDAKDVSDWNDVIAVRIELILRRKVKGGETLEKRVVHEVNLRNREPV